VDGTVNTLLAQVGADVALLAQSTIVQAGAALGAFVGLGLPGGAIAWKVLRNGRNGNRKNSNGGVPLARVERLDAQYESLCDRVTDMSEQSARAIADLRREVREDFTTMRSDTRIQLDAVRDSVGKVHGRVDALMRGGG
jgi:hypothetical protein